MKILAAASLLALAACTQPKVPEDHFYRLTSAAPQSAGAQLNGSIEVHRFVADGLTANRPIVYTSGAGSNQLQAYHYHFWSEPPAIMLQNALANYLRRANLTKSVVTPELRLEPEYIATGKIIRFEQITGASPSIAVELELGLKETGSGKLIHFGHYTVEQPASDPSIGTAAGQISQAINSIYARFLADIRWKR